MTEPPQFDTTGESTVTAVQHDRSPVDPRPIGETTGDGQVQIRGWRCTACAHPIAQPVLRCPLCKGDMALATFSAAGTVWASTCLRVRVPGYEPPFAVAYLSLDDGPRMLVHTPGASPLRPGHRAVVTAVSQSGDLVATITEEAA